MCNFTELSFLLLLTSKLSNMVFISGKYATLWRIPYLSDHPFLSWVDMLRYTVYWMMLVSVPQQNPPSTTLSHPWNEKIQICPLTLQPCGHCSKVFRVKQGIKMMNFYHYLFEVRDKITCIIFKLICVYWTYNYWNKKISDSLTSS